MATGGRIVMAEPFYSLPASTFVVRFRRLWSLAGAGWRGRIEHVQSGNTSSFLSIEEMIDFIGTYGILLEDGDSCSAGEELNGGDT
jgi:hypothetical protein